MNGRILEEPTPERRIAALAFSIVLAQFTEFRSRNPWRQDTIFIEEFLDYHDLDGPLAVALDREFLLDRLRVTDEPEEQAKLMKQLQKVVDEIRQLITRLRL